MRSALLTPPPSVAVNVDWVQVADLNQLIWAFTSPIASLGANCPQLIGIGLGGSHAPISIEAGDTNTIYANYAGNYFDGSSLWQVAQALTGISFVGGTLVIPENGEVLA